MSGHFRMATWVWPYFRGAWVQRHQLAVEFPNVNELPIVLLLRGWCLMAVAYDKTIGGNIGSDSVFGPPWLSIGLALRTLLNADLGRLDAGTIDAIITHNLAEAGFDPEML